MKKLLLIILILSSYHSFSQDQQKLEKYKSLFDQGLIDSTEYVRLKSGVLFSTTEKKSIQSDNNIIKYKGQIHAGIVMTILGFGLFAYSLVYASDPPTLTDISTKGVEDYNHDLKTWKNNRAVLYVASGGVTLLGIIFIASGSTSLQLYKANKLQAVMNENGIGLRLML